MVKADKIGVDEMGRNRYTQDTIIQMSLIISSQVDCNIFYFYCHNSVYVYGIKIKNVTMLCCRENGKINILLTYIE
jgi:hypothetical protein